MFEPPASAERRPSSPRPSPPGEGELVSASIDVKAAATPARRCARDGRTPGCGRPRPQRRDFGPDVTRHQRSATKGRPLFQNIQRSTFNGRTAPGTGADRVKKTCPGRGRLQGGKIGRDGRRKKPIRATAAKEAGQGMSTEETAVRPDQNRASRLPLASDRSSGTIIVPCGSPQ